MWIGRKGPPRSRISQTPHLEYRNQLASTIVGNGTVSASVAAIVTARRWQRVPASLSDDLRSIRHA